MKNAIIRTFAIVALLGFGSEMKAVRSSEAFYFQMTVFRRMKISGNYRKGKILFVSRWKRL